MRGWLGEFEQFSNQRMTVRAMMVVLNSTLPQKLNISNNNKSDDYIQTGTITSCSERKCLYE